MRTNLKVKETKEYKLGINDVPELTAIIKEALQAESWLPDNCHEQLHEIEFLSRDGFSAHSHNHGGFILRGFTDLAGIYGAGLTFNAKGLDEAIEKQIESNREYVKLKDDGSEECNDAFYEVLSDESNSILFEIQVMYGGFDEKGIHTLWVSAAVNVEGPYHRRSISWMPGLKCEYAKEVEITFKTKKQAKLKLISALKKVCKEIF